MPSGSAARKTISADRLSQLRNLWLALTWAPLAVHFQSVLLGYMVVLALYAVLGFSGACYGLCYCIGFQSKDNMMRVAVTSALLLTGYSCLRMFERHMPAAEAALSHLFVVNGISVSATKLSGEPPDHEYMYRWSESSRSAWLQPFAPACTVLGSLTLYLAMLIMSSLYYHPHPHQPYYRDGAQHPPKPLSYNARNWIMVVCLLAGLLVGSLEGMPGLTNTALTFAVLWLMEKWCELHLESKWNMWLLVLALSTVVYYCALYLHLRPDFVASLFAN